MYFTGGVNRRLASSIQIGQEIWVLVAAITLILGSGHESSLQIKQLPTCNTSFVVLLNRPVKGQYTRRTEKHDQKSRDNF
jgi:hypothetical protein